jgi:serine/threonine-protein kinase
LELSPGTPFGPFRIVASLGRGGMASVYRARDASLDRDVALKVLPAEFLHDPTFADRFRQEARVAAKLEHPHVVPIHGYGIDNGRPWMALRLLAGGSLADRLRQGPLPPAEAARILSEVGSALDAAHARGIVHRDVKPANILLDENGRAYLADFGVARMLEGKSTTLTGMVQGTPAYMAPEQAMGAKVDRRADVYALGIVAFECLTGRVPYTGTTPVAVLMKHVTEPVPEPAPGEVPDALRPLIRRSLAKSPTDRWPTTRDFTDALARETARLTAKTRVDELPTLDVSLHEGAATTTVTPTPTVPSAVPDVTPLDVTRVRPGGIGGGLVVAALGLGLLAVVGAVVFALQVIGPTPVREEASVRRGTPVPPPPVATPRPAPVEPAAPVATAALAPTPGGSPSASAPAPAVAARPLPRPTPRLTPAAPALEPPPPSTTRSALGGRLRVHCEARLEPALFRKSSAKDVTDSLADLREAIAERDRLELVDTKAAADAVIQVLERGRQPATFGMRKVRVRVVAGSASIELVGQDSMTGFNTWSGAAKGALKQVEAWLERRTSR